MDDKSVTCVLLGVSEESKAYRLYNPVTKKVIISRDVVFDEEISWKWDKSYEEQLLVDLEWGDDETNKTKNRTSKSGNEDDNGVEESRAVPYEFENGEGRSRVRRAPVWMRDYETGEGLFEEDADVNLAFYPSVDRIYFNEAIKSSKWREAMNLEMRSIEKNDTWTLTDLPEGAKAIGVKWVFKTKMNELGEIDKHKARLVAKGYAQEYGVDYSEVFAPVAWLDTVRMVIALAAQKGWSIYQLDVKSDFLHGELNEEVFVEQPEEYVKKDEPHKVYRLKKALYGLKQAPRAWFSRIESYFLKEGFERSHSEQTLFTKTNKKGKLLIVSLYVDDLIYTGNDVDMINEFKKSMMGEFDMSDLGKMRYFLGIEVLQQNDGIFISQKKYAMDVLKRFGMEECNAVHNPIVSGFKMTKDEDEVKVDSTYFKQIVGSLMYLTKTRPDLMFIVSLICRFMAHPLYFISLLQKGY